MTRKRYGSVQDYLADLAPESRRRLNRIRRLVKQIVPAATEGVSYNIPAFRLERIFLYVAAFKDHVSIFPPVKNDARLVKALARYRNAKGNLKFALEAPLPEALIVRVIKALARQSAPKERAPDR
jgi:uncharacterized protein YdhG (YjbR/CyaY superfamily)